MQDFLFPEAWASWLSQVTLVLVWTVPALIVYGWLADRTVFEQGGRLRSLRFGGVDMGIGTVLTILFTFSSVAGFRTGNADAQSPEAVPTSGQMIAGTVSSAVVFLMVISGILAVLRLRGISWRDCFGPTRLGPLAVLGRAVGLLAMAFPLIAGAIVLGRVLLAAAGYVDDSPQDIVNFLAHNASRTARWVVAIFAVVVAPMEEEFIFRGYLYGIVRQYAGPTVGIVFNAALFAAIHVHLPSFAGLFVLAVCLTLAYEWSGSIFVPMVMHALFNSYSVIDLLAGGGSNG